MSYCNQVLIVMDKNEYQKMREGASQLDIELAPEKDIIFNSAQIIPSRYNMVILYWDGYKHWEEDTTNEVVDYILNYLRTQQKSYHYIRIGEGFEEKEDKEDKFYIASEDEFIAIDILELGKDLLH